MDNRQTIDNLKGEVDFRRKLSKQQVEGQHIFDDEFDRAGIEVVLRERMETTSRHIRSLIDKNFVISPYVEIGAERCQRSMVMETDLNAGGAAVDLSFDMLKSADYYKDVFKKQLPLRICADLNHAPFKTGSIPFVFCYQTLHHFPDPAPIVAEVHRFIAPGGVFFFAEEPFKRGFHLSLYKTDKAFSTQHRDRGVLRKALDHLFADLTCNEVEHGVIENDDIPLKVWRKTLAVFDRKDIRLVSINRIASDLDESVILPKRLFNSFWGGEITGTCYKAGKLEHSTGSILDALACPVCLASGKESDLKCAPDAFICQECGVQHPVKDGVVFLMEPELRGRIYPEILI